MSEIFILCGIALVVLAVWVIDLRDERADLIRRERFLRTQVGYAAAAVIAANEDVAELREHNAILRAANQALGSAGVGLSSLHFDQPPSEAKA